LNQQSILALFCFFFWKRRPLLVGYTLGARPQTPWVGFAEFWVNKPSAKYQMMFIIQPTTWYAKHGGVFDVFVGYPKDGIVFTFLNTAILTNVMLLFPHYKTVQLNPRYV
jgi:hypothetical protein